MPSKFLTFENKKNQRNRNTSHERQKNLVDEQKWIHTTHSADGERKCSSINFLIPFPDIDKINIYKYCVTHINCIECE